LWGMFSYNTFPRINNWTTEQDKTSVVSASGCTVNWCSQMTTLRSMTYVNHIGSITAAAGRSRYPFRILGITADRAASEPVVGLWRPGRPVDNSIGPVARRGWPIEKTAHRRSRATAVFGQRWSLYRPINGISEVFIDIVSVIVVRLLVSSGRIVGDDVIKQVSWHGRRSVLSLQLYCVVSPEKQIHTATWQILHLSNTSYNKTALVCFVEKIVKSNNYKNLQSLSSEDSQSKLFLFLRNTKSLMWSCWVPDIYFRIEMYVNRLHLISNPSFSVLSEPY